jgi:hypothetical protein
MCVTQGWLLSRGNGFGVPEKARSATTDADADFDIKSKDRKHSHIRVVKKMMIYTKKCLGECEDEMECNDRLLAAAQPTPIGRAGTATSS